MARNNVGTYVPLLVARHREANSFGWYRDLSPDPTALIPPPCIPGILQPTFGYVMQVLYNYVCGSIGIKDLFVSKIFDLVNNWVKYDMIDRGALRRSNWGAKASEFDAKNAVWYMYQECQAQRASDSSMTVLRVRFWMGKISHMP